LVPPLVTSLWSWPTIIDMFHHEIDRQGTQSTKNVLYALYIGIFHHKEARVALTKGWTPRSGENLRCWWKIWGFWNSFSYKIVLKTLKFHEAPHIVTRYKRYVPRYKRNDVPRYSTNNDVMTHVPCVMYNYVHQYNEKMRKVTKGWYRCQFFWWRQKLYRFKFLALFCELGLKILGPCMLRKMTR
jgi:hypothetical protein